MRAVVERYAARGFRLVYYPTRLKGPRDEKWPTLTYAPEDYRPGDNVGVMLGTEVAPGRFLVDVDFDWTEGTKLARRLLPATDFGYGRASRKIGHAFYTTSAPVVSRKFDDIDGSGFVELRGTKRDGALGFQSMVPPSIHPSGEPVAFREDGEIRHDDALPRRVVLYAIACLLLKHFGPRAFVHDSRLSFAGFLLQSGVTEDETLDIGRAVADATGNNVADAETAIRSTAARLRNAQPVTGAGALAKALGDDGKKIVDRIREWLEVNDLVLDANDPVPSARAFVVARHTTDDALTLRRQAGVFYAYQPAVAAYHERADATVRADLYGFLETAKTRGKETLLPFRPTKEKVSNILDALNAVTNLDPAIVAPCWLRDDPGLNPLDILACPSGLLHIPTRRLLPATPHFFTLNGLEFDFDPTAPAPANWLAFLDQLWPDDRESIEMLQEWFGYVLTPDTRFQKIGMVIGPKRSGKGVMGRVLRRLVGDRNTCSPTLASFGDQFGKQGLIGKTLAIVADARLGARIDSASVAEALLSISGEDSQTVQRKFLPDWNGKLSARFLILANELPRIGDVSGALASRFVVFVLKQSFYGKEDLGLYDRLAIELPGILNWALEGRDRLYARGWFVPPQSANDLIEEFADLNSPEAAMLRECTETKAGSYVEQPRLFAAWKLWCSENGRDRPGTTQMFARSVRTALPWIGSKRHGPQGAQVRCWEGLRLTEEWAEKVEAVPEGPQMEFPGAPEM